MGCSLFSPGTLPLLPEASQHETEVAHIFRPPHPPGGHMAHADSTSPLMAKAHPQCR